MNFSQRLLFLSLLGLPVALVFFLIFKDSDQSREDKHFFSDLKSLYSQGRLLELKPKIEAEKNRIIVFDEGCDLILSVYAKLELYEDLNKAAKDCLIQEKGLSGISYEALALSALKTQRMDEALDILEKSLNKSRSDKLLSSLAMLAYEKKDYKATKNYFVQLIKNSGIWSAWLLRAYKYPELFEHPEFIDQLVLELDKKDFVSKHVEEKLLRYAKLFKLDTSVAVLEKRLSDT